MPWRKLDTIGRNPPSSPLFTPVLALCYNSRKYARAMAAFRGRPITKRLIATLSLVATLSLAQAQSSTFVFPKPVFTARTIIVFNETHNEAVEQGATEALKRWGKFTIVDDPDQADITLTFDKKSEHEGSNSQTIDKDGNPGSTYSMSFGSSIHMHATLRGSSAAFYNATTTASKKKAGDECVTDFQQAYLSRR